jgi:O-antigen/teichoic acid export membrane protein
MSGLDGWQTRVNQRLHALTQSSTAQSFLRIFSGQFLAQLVSFLATFLLANVYSPRAFSNLAIVVSISSILTPFLSGTLENPIVLERTLNRAMRLVMAAFLLISLTAFLLIILSAALQLFDLHLGWLSQYTVILGYLTLGIVIAIFSAARLICEAMLLRRHRLEAINRLIVIPVLANPVIALLLWRLGLVDEGLALALLLAYLFQFVYCFLLLPEVFRARLRFGLAIKTLFKYKSYPLLLSPTSVLDSVTASLPIIVGVSSQAALTIGNYALMQRIFLLPINVITNAVSKSYLAHSAAKLRESPESFFRYTLRLAIALASTSFLAVALLSAIAGPLLSRLVASEWKQAFVIFSALAPSIVCKFVASSLSSSLLSANAKRLLVYWKVIAFVSTYFSLSLAARMDYSGFFRALMLNDTAIYLLLLAMIFYACRPRPPLLQS